MRLHSSAARRRRDTDDDDDSANFSHFRWQHFRFVAALGRRSTSGKCVERHRAGRVNERVDNDDDVDVEGG